MLQKKVKRPLGFGSVVTLNQNFINNYNKRKGRNKNSKVFFSNYLGDDYLIVDRFISLDGQKYYKIVPIKRHIHGHSGTHFVLYTSESFVNIKHVSESMRSFKIMFEPSHLSVVNEELLKRYGKGLT